MHKVIGGKSPLRKPFRDKKYIIIFLFYLGLGNRKTKLIFPSNKMQDNKERCETLILAKQDNFVEVASPMKTKQKKFQSHTDLVASLHPFDFKRCLSNIRILYFCLSIYAFPKWLYVTKWTLSWKLHWEKKAPLSTIGRYNKNCKSGIKKMRENVSQGNKSWSWRLSEHVACESRFSQVQAVEEVWSIRVERERGTSLFSFLWIPFFRDCASEKKF